MVTGNTCDDANDATGCIFTQNLLVNDATADEIDAAVAGISASGSNSAASASSTDAVTISTAAAVAATTANAATTASSATTASAATAACPAAATVTSVVASSAGGNLQTFTGARMSFLLAQPQ